MQAIDLRERPTNSRCSAQNSLRGLRTLPYYHARTESSTVLPASATGYDRWKGHDMQARAYDNTEQAINRVVRSVLSWEACEKAAKELKTRDLLKALAQRDTAAAEDMMRAAVVNAQMYFDQMYAG